MNEQKLPKDIMRLILDFYLSDYSWISFGLAKHIANKDYICCSNCSKITNCKKSLYHNKQAALKNILALPSLKSVCKFWDYYITEWFNNTWGVSTWKKLHHIKKMIRDTDKATMHKIVYSFFDQLFGIINSDKTFAISFTSRDAIYSEQIYLIKILLDKGRLKLQCTEISNNKQVMNFLMVQDKNEDFGWHLSSFRFSHGYEYEDELNICDLMALMHLPHVNNMIDPDKVEHNKIRYSCKKSTHLDDY